MVLILPAPLTKEMAKKRIGIKYCGGCNPTFERVEMVEKIKFLVGGQFDFLHYDQGDFDGLLFIQGCERACAFGNLNPRETPYFSVTKETEWRKVIDWLGHLNRENDN